MPYPVEKIIKVKSKIINQLRVGNIEDENSFALLWTVEHGAEEPFLSADNNFFYPYLVLNYKVRDIFKFHYNFKNPETLINNVAYKIITNIFAGNKFYHIISTMRETLSENIRSRLQQNLDMLGCGIEIVAVNIKDMHPPVFIGDVFEDVIAAMQDKEKYIDEAYGYRNRAIPEANGEFHRRINGAKAYVVKKVDESEGDAGRFLLQIAEMNNKRELTKKRIYLDQLKSSLVDNKKIIVDPESGIPDVWLNFKDNPYIRTNQE